MAVSNNAIAGISAVGIAAVLLFTGFAYATWGDADAGVIDPPAQFYFTSDGDVVTLQGDPIEGVGVSGTSYFSFSLASEGYYLCFVQNNIWVYDVDTGLVIDSITSIVSMELDMRTLAVSNSDHLGTQAIDVTLDGKVQQKTCDVYRVVRDDTGDMFTVYVSAEDKAVYALDFQVKRFLSEESGIDVPVSVSGNAQFRYGYRDVTPAYTDDPSVGTYEVFNMGGTGTLTTPEGTVEVDCAGTITQTVVCVGSAESYGQQMTYYLLNVRGVSADGTATFDSDCLLGVTGAGAPEGGQLYQRHVDVNGRPCTLWTLEYSNYDMQNVEELTAYDWALFITVAIAEDGTGDVVSYSTDDRTVSYTLDETGHHTMVLDKICSLNTVY